MSALYERSLLGQIEGHELFGEHELARNLRIKFCSYIKKKNQQKEKELMIQKSHVFEGTLVAAGWDRYDHVSQSSLYTQDEEDILLDHRLGIRKFKPYLNQKVRIIGNIVSINSDGRKVLVEKISRITGGLTKPLNAFRDKFDNLLEHKSA
ncbi:hypothetical protein N9N67_08750 [Bacteriovoracaceae bacterium]|nr:hypothetical protein [Bacteriovoracaceae bacterium]